jgi:hypothetical protein
VAHTQQEGKGRRILSLKPVWATQPILSQKKKKKQKNKKKKTNQRIQELTNEAQPIDNVLPNALRLLALEPPLDLLPFELGCYRARLLFWLPHDSALH